MPNCQRISRILGGAFCAIATLGVCSGESQEPFAPAAWQDQLLRDLCARYEGGLQRDASLVGKLDQIAVRIGQQLAAQGIGPGGVPAEDLAKLALLLAQRPKSGANSPREVASPLAPPPSAAAAPPGTGTKPGSPTQLEENDRPLIDTLKGQEGIRQGIERIRTLKPAERFVITGDITAGIQSATVARGSDLTSMFGRTRVNVVAKAVPGSANGLVSEGHFFIQLQAAGGPFDSSPVGGPHAFTPLNDVATRRSRFNEGLSRGNLYLGKTFYQQALRLNRGQVAGRIGIIDLSDFFDTNAFANNESRQFMNTALVNSAAYRAGFVAPGVMAEYRRQVQRDWVDGAVFRLGYAVSRTERAFTSPIWTGEAELDTLLGGKRGSWRLGGTLGNVAGVGGVHGIHVGADHWMSQRLGVFGRYAVGGRGPGSRSLSRVHRSYSGGVQWRFVDQAERTSAFAIGFSQAFPLAPDGSLSSERILETYYRWQVTDQFSLTPDFQFIFGAGGRRSGGTQAVLGLRMFFGL